MKEFYDIIIIGAGIAGCSLAYNLKRYGHSKSVLIIDKNEVGGTRGHHYRNTFENIVKDYNLPYYKKFNGVKFGMEDKVFLTINTNFYALDYKKTCKYLIKRSSAIFKKEIAININFNNNLLITDKNKYSYKYLIDCSGSKFFIRKLLNKKPPFRYWLGKVRVFKNNLNLNNDYFLYSYATNNNYCEELYFLKDKIIQGDWHYTNKVDFKLIKPHNKTFYNTYKEKLKILDESNVVIPCSPVFPLVYKNIALLGDSFGNSTPSAAEGIRPIIRSSEILSESIIKKDLSLYEKEWKKKYLRLYYKHLVSRIDGNSELMINKILLKYPKRSKFCNMMKKYPDLVLKRLRNEDFILPKEIRKSFPLHHLIIRQLIYHTYVKLKFLTS